MWKIIENKPCAGGFICALGKPGKIVYGFGKNRYFSLFSAIKGIFFAVNQRGKHISHNRLR